MFKFLLLKQNNPRAFWNFYALSVQALGLANQLHYFQVKIDVKFFMFLVSDD